MPSWYTGVIEENPDFTFAQYAMRCARSTGALVHMRDMDDDAAIVLDEIKAPTYHREMLDDLSKKLLDARAMTHAEIEREVELRAWHDKRMYDQELADYKKKSERYQSMLAQVKAWKPPSADHRDLKKFMIEQIEQAMPYHPDRYRNDQTLHDDPKQALVGLDHEAYRTAKIDDILRDMEYHEKHWKTDLERARKSVTWVKQLIASLK